MTSFKIYGESTPHSAPKFVVIADNKRQQLAQLDTKQQTQ